MISDRIKSGSFKMNGHLLSYKLYTLISIQYKTLIEIKFLQQNSILSMLEKISLLSLHNNTLFPGI